MVLRHHAYSAVGSPYIYVNFLMGISVKSQRGLKSADTQLAIPINSFYIAGSLGMAENVLFFVFLNKGDKRHQLVLL